MFHLSIHTVQNFCTHHLFFHMPDEGTGKTHRSLVMKMPAPFTESFSFVRNISDIVRPANSQTVQLAQFRH